MSRVLDLIGVVRASRLVAEKALQFSRPPSQNLVKTGNIGDANRTSNVETVPSILIQTSELKDEICLVEPPSTGPNSPNIEQASNAEKHVESSLPEIEPSVNVDTHPYRLEASRVPSSRIGRLWQYGGLATSMGVGAVGELMRRTVRGGNDNSSILMSEGNVKRLVKKLSQMRGAALKIGQMMSIQDSRILPKQIEEIVSRVQNQANYMPKWQMERVMSDSLGPSWKDLFDDFNEIPIAAASIGQVHEAKWKPTGMPIAVKIQYPGVAESIDSDLSNLKILVSASRLLPPGLYLENTIKVLQRELKQETDYVREADSMIKFKELLKDEKEFKVPQIIKEASTSKILLSERLFGHPLAIACGYDQNSRDRIGTKILRLCLMELFQFRFMQTDPNPTNFLYNSSTQQLELLDFGATRHFSSEFTSLYARLLLAAADCNQEAVAEYSKEMGYLTGFESPTMIKAHVDSVIVLGEPFQDQGSYDFSEQTVTDRVRNYIPVMLRERLTPPPEETYTLHRKLSGAFLLCSRLKSRVNCRELLQLYAQQ